MSLDVDTTIDIARPPDEVAAYEFEPSNDPAWIGGISEARLLTEGPVGVGSRVARVASFLGRRIDYVMEVVDLVPGRRLSMHAIKSPFPMDVDYELEPAPAGTRARIRVRGAAGGSYRLAGPFLGAMVRRSIASDIRALKRIVEGRPPGG